MTQRGAGVQRALDELRFGATRTLNVRDSMPTGDDAARRVEQWLRIKQVEGAREVLVITGRGAGSPAGIPIVRRAVEQRLAALRRHGVVRDVIEHNEGALVVRLDSLRALLEAPRRTRDRRSVPAPTTSIQGLEPETLDALRQLARRALESLGIRDDDGPLLEAELARQFSLFARGAPGTRAPDGWMRAAAERAIRDFDDGPSPR